MKDEGCQKTDFGFQNFFSKKKKKKKKFFQNVFKKCK